MDKPFSIRKSFNRCAKIFTLNYSLENLTKTVVLRYPNGYNINMAEFWGRKHFSKLFYAACACVCAALITVSTVLLVNLKRDTAVRAAVVTDMDPLFRQGGVNANLADQLASIALLAVKTPCRIATSVDGSNGLQIRTANGGAPCIIQIFQSLGTSEASLTSGANPNRFSNMKWALTYITHGNGQSIFTFFAVNRYRTHRWNGTVGTPRNLAIMDYNVAAPTATTKTNTAYPAFGVVSSGGAEIRNVIMNDFCAFLDNNYSYVAPFIARPRQVPWQVQQQPFCEWDEQAINPLMGERLDDLIWLPSSFETGRGSNGQYGSDLFDWLNAYKGYSLTEQNYYVWLRTPINAVQSSNCFILNRAFGTVNGRETLANEVEAPMLAIHIVLPTYSKTNITAGFSPNAVTGAGAGVTVN